MVDDNAAAAAAQALALLKAAGDAADNDFGCSTVSAGDGHLLPNQSAGRTAAMRRSRRLAHNPPEMQGSK